MAYQALTARIRMASQLPVDPRVSSKERTNIEARNQANTTFSMVIRRPQNSEVRIYSQALSTIHKQAVMCYTTPTIATKQHTYLNRITVDPRIMVGKPVVKGARIPVELVLKRLSQDLDMKTIFEAYPRLTEADIKACLAYAEAVLAGEDIYLLETDEHASPQTNV